MLSFADLQIIDTCKHEEVLKFLIKAMNAQDNCHGIDKELSVPPGATSWFPGGEEGSGGEGSL